MAPPEVKLPELDEVVKLYDAIQELIGLLDDHRWSVRMTDKDSHFVSQFRTHLISLSNFAFWAHHRRDDSAPRPIEALVKTMNEFLETQSDSPRDWMGDALAHFANYLGYPSVKQDEKTKMLEVRKPDDTEQD